MSSTYHDFWSSRCVLAFRPFRETRDVCPRQLLTAKCLRITNECGCM